VSKLNDVPASPQDGAPALEVAAVYRQYGSAVARWAARLGGPDLSVEDTVQDVFLVVSRRLGEFRGAAKLSTWLFGITEQTVRNWRRRQRWRRWFARLTGRIEDTVEAPHPTPIEALERRQATERFYEILDELPERHRTVLVLFEVEALSTQAIAELLGVKVAAVRVRLHRSRRDFRRRLAALEEQESRT
jgi:RNA polymerase sigma-70 factor (ECF subfamily)